MGSYRLSGHSSQPISPAARVCVHASVLLWASGPHPSPAGAQVPAVTPLAVAVAVGRRNPRVRVAGCLASGPNHCWERTSYPRTRCPPSVGLPGRRSGSQRAPSPVRSTLASWATTLAPTSQLASVSALPGCERARVWLHVWPYVWLCVAMCVCGYVCVFGYVGVCGCARVWLCACVAM